MFLWKLFYCSGFTMNGARDEMDWDGIGTGMAIICLVFFFYSLKDPLHFAATSNANKQTGGLKYIFYCHHCCWKAIQGRGSPLLPTCVMSFAVSCYYWSFSLFFITYLVTYVLPLLEPEPTCWNLSIPPTLTLLYFTLLYI